MNLTEKNIINALESYKNYHALTVEKMAELCGMSDKARYSDWRNGKTKNAKLVYFLNFLKNTNTNPEKFFHSFAKENVVVSDLNNSDEPTSPYNTKCIDPGCIEEKEILKAHISTQKKFIELQEKTIEKLEEQGGGSHPGKHNEGDVDKHRQTG